MHAAWICSLRAEATAACKRSAGADRILVNGKNKMTFNEMIMMDLFYLENMSILLDLKIMLKTGAVIAGQLLEYRTWHNAIGSGAKRTKLEGGCIPLASSPPRPEGIRNRPPD